MKHYKAQIKEIGNDAIFTPEYYGNITIEELEKFWGVHDTDVEWYIIEEVKPNK